MPVVSDDKKLVGVVPMRYLGARRRSVRILDVGERRSGRAIFLVIETSPLPLSAEEGE